MSELVNEPYVLRRDDGKVTTLTLNRPQQRNALSRGLIDALTETIQTVAADPAIKVIVLAANGPVFSSGHDLKEMRANPDPAWTRALFDACSAMMLAMT